MRSPSNPIRGVHSVLLCIFLALFFSGCSDSTPIKENSTFPNLILISIDTLRADFVGRYGHPGNLTPFLDSLADQGVLFEFAYSQSARTLPSHASLMTSRYYNCHLATQDSGASFWLSEEELTLAEILSEHGFATGASTDGGFVSARFGFSQGFDYYDEPDILQKQEDRSNPTAGIVEVNKRALNWLDQVAPSKPFFLFLHYYDVHNYMHDIPGALETRRAIMLGELEPTEELVNAMLDSYARRLKELDDELRKLFLELESRNRLDSTLVIITSDHGEGFGEHGWFDHGGYLDQEAIWVPLIFTGLDLPHGLRISEPAQNIDVLPTILDLFSIGLPDNIQGYSLVPLIYGWDESPRLAVSEDDRPRGTKAIMSVSKKLFWYPDQTPEFRLVDLDNDPMELNDLAEEYPELVINMHNRMMDILDCRGSQTDVRSILRRPPSRIERATLEALGYF